MPARQIKMMIPCCDMAMAIGQGPNPYHLKFTPVSTQSYHQKTRVLKSPAVLPWSLATEHRKCSRGAHSSFRDKASSITIIEHSLAQVNIAIELSLSRRRLFVPSHRVPSHHPPTCLNNSQDSPQLCEAHGRTSIIESIQLWTTLARTSGVHLRAAGRAGGGAA